MSHFRPEIETGTLAYTELPEQVSAWEGPGPGTRSSVCLQINLCCWTWNSVQPHNRALEWPWVWGCEEGQRGAKKLSSGDVCSGGNWGKRRMVCSVLRGLGYLAWNSKVPGRSFEGKLEKTDNSVTTTYLQFADVACNLCSKIPLHVVKLQRFLCLKLLAWMCEDPNDHLWKTALEDLPSQSWSLRENHLSSWW